MEYLIRLIQVHETFRKPELEALATLAQVKLEFVHYDPEVRIGTYVMLVPS
jgi:tRNA (guanine10-N2)-methyltransferase